VPSAKSEYSVERSSGRRVAYNVAVGAEEVDSTAAAACSCKNWAAAHKME
jgi:hypothetical protein